MSLEDGLKELAAREARALAMGGPEKVARRKAAGLLDARARIEALIARHPSLADAGSPAPSR